MDSEDDIEDLPINCSDAEILRAAEKIAWELRINGTYDTEDEANFSEGISLPPTRGFVWKNPSRFSEESLGDIDGAIADSVVIEDRRLSDLRTFSRTPEVSPPSAIALREVAPPVASAPPEPEAPSASAELVPPPLPLGASAPRDACGDAARAPEREPVDELAFLCDAMRQQMPTDGDTMVISAYALQKMIEQLRSGIQLVVQQLQSPAPLCVEAQRTLQGWTTSDQAEAIIRLLEDVRKCQDEFNLRVLGELVKIGQAQVTLLNAFHGQLGPVLQGVQQRLGALETYMSTFSSHATALASLAMQAGPVAAQTISSPPAKRRRGAGPADAGLPDPEAYNLSPYVARSGDSVMSYEEVGREFGYV